MSVAATIMRKPKLHNKIVQKTTVGMTLLQPLSPNRD